MKRFATLLLALIMILSLAAPTFAAETSTLTIKTTVGHTYHVLQLLKGDVSNLVDGSGTLTNITRGSNLHADYDVDAFIAKIKDASGNFLKDEELANAAYSCVTTSAMPYKSVVGTGEEIAIDADNGYYIILDSWNNGEIENDALSRYMVAVVGDTTIIPKVEVPKIDKKITDTTDETGKASVAAIGDIVNYEITGKVPNTEGYEYYYYVIHDTLSKGLTLNDNFRVDVGGLTLARNTDYKVYVTQNEDSSTSFRLAFIDLKELIKTEKIDIGDDISITYSATINDKVEVGQDPNTNTAKLEYSNNPYLSERNDKTDEPGVPAPGTATGEGPESVTKTYVTELTIDKVDNKGMALEGAEFKLSGTKLNKVIIKIANEFRPAAEGETAEYYKLKNGTYTTVAPITTEEGNNVDLYEDTTPQYVRVVNVTESTMATGVPNNVTAYVDESGRITFTGLNAGEYTLTETVTPDGYNTIEPIKFTITAELNNGNVTWGVNNEAVVLDETNGVFHATIQNIPGSLLPSTGGMGTTLFYIFGGIMMLAAVVLLVTKKRMANT